MWRRQLHPKVVGQCSNGCRFKNGPLFIESVHESIDDGGDVVSTKDSDKAIDFWASFEKSFLLTLGKTTCDDYATNLALAFEI